MNIWNTDYTPAMKLAFTAADDGSYYLSIDG
jgi:hypothetical protein